MRGTESGTHRSTKGLFAAGWPAAGALLIILIILTPGTVFSQEDRGRTFGEMGQGVGLAVMGENIHPDRASSVPIPAAIKRGFYLTNASYYPSQALTACAKGYHMASMFELLDVSTLNYHYKHPHALVYGDCGYGPPSAISGWVRTGFFTSNSQVAGAGNCKVWTSDALGDYGTIVNLRYDWTVPSTGIGPWEALSSTCNGGLPVWCVSNSK